MNEQQKIAKEETLTLARIQHNKEKINMGVHERHCCIFHGCKYGDEDCPVALAGTKQDNVCELCSGWEAEDNSIVVYNDLADCHNEYNMQNNITTADEFIINDGSYKTQFLSALRNIMHHSNDETQVLKQLERYNEKEKSNMYDGDGYHQAAVINLILYLKNNI